MVSMKETFSGSQPSFRVLGAPDAEVGSEPIGDLCGSAVKRQPGHIGVTVAPKSTRRATSAVETDLTSRLFTKKCFISSSAILTMQSRGYMESTTEPKYYAFSPQSGKGGSVEQVVSVLLLRVGSASSAWTIYMRARSYM